GDEDNGIWAIDVHVRGRVDGERLHREDLDLRAIALGHEPRRVGEEADAEPALRITRSYATIRAAQHDVLVLVEGEIRREVRWRESERAAVALGAVGGAVHGCGGPCVDAGRSPRIAIRRGP